MKEKLFTEEYPVDLNATKAAERAGYSIRTAYSAGHRLLKKVEIQQALQESFRLRSVRTEITQDMVLKELATIAFADIAVYVEWGPEGLKLVSSKELPEAATRAVVEVSESSAEGGKFRFKLHDKVRTLELLAKHLGMLADPGASREDPLYVAPVMFDVELTQVQIEALVALDPALRSKVIDQQGNDV